MRSRKILKFISLFLLLAAPSFSQEEEIPILEAIAEIAASRPPSKAEVPQEGYTINYNTVSIVEYIRFASKICNVNFIFNEQDLNFTVTVVSEDPITPDNVMATLIQILRIHDLQMIEQGNNLVIHKNDAVKQMATVVDQAGQGSHAPMVTRIFRVQNIKPESAATIIRSMISKTAILEASPDTRQLILTDVTANVDKVAMLIESMDSPHSNLKVGVYETVQNESEYLIEVASKIMAPIAQGNPFIMVPVGLSNSIYIVSLPEFTDQTMDLLKQLDIPPKKAVATARKMKGEKTLALHLQNRSVEEVRDDLVPLIANTDIDPQAITWNKSSNSVFYNGSQDQVEILTRYITALDTPYGALPSNQTTFFYQTRFLSPSVIKERLTGMNTNLYDSVYADDDTGILTFKTTEKNKSQLDKLLTSIDKSSGTDQSSFVYSVGNRRPEDVAIALNKMGKNESNKALAEALKSAAVNEGTNTITVTGQEWTFPEVKDRLAKIDTQETKPSPGSKKSLIIYQIHGSYEQLNPALQKLRGTLDSNDDLAKTIDSKTPIPESNTIVFNGTEQSLKRLQELLPILDNPKSAPNSQFVVIQVKHKKCTQLASELKDVIAAYKKKNKPSDAVANPNVEVQCMPSSNTIIITGDADLVKKLSDFAQANDVPSIEGKPTTTPVFLQKANAQEVIDELQDQESIYKDDKEIFQVLKKLQPGPKNSIYVTGPQQAVDYVTNLITQLDVAQETPTKTSYALHKPVHISAAEIEEKLKGTAQGMKGQSLADKDLIATLESAHTVPATGKILLTGTPDSVAKATALVKDIDVPQGTVQPAGAKVVVIYPVKGHNGAKLLALLKTQTSSTNLAETAKGASYIPDSNSIFIYGTPADTAQIVSILEKLDVSGPAPAPGPVVPAPSSFSTYKPVAVPGTKLVSMMDEFIQNLQTTGLSMPDLFTAKLQYMESINAILITGSPAGIEQVKEQLKEMDVSGNLPPSTPGGDQPIQAIDNTSFLVYKLQFHKGDEIQGALRQIAKDLMLSNAPVNQNLLNAINSIQWLEVTNSLLCSGDSDTLARLRELIKNLDVPLKQVFIEMLVIQTTLTNSLQFGLEWGANYKYKDKFSGVLNNIVPQANTQNFNGTQDLMNTALKGIGLNGAGLPSPTPQQVPILGPGFDLGIIGEVIRHGGDTYLSIGSLVAALQADTEASIVMTPKLITQDGRTSTIFQGSNIPFAGSFVSNTGGTGGQATVGTTNIEYRDIGISLTITPVLGNSNIVTLDISLDQTSTASNATSNQISLNSTTGLPSSINGIQTSKTSMQTTVHVPDNHFLILSGMVNESNTKTKTGIPCLGGLPLIGAAFSQDNTLTNNTNVVIFMRPHIINSIEDITRVTREQEEFFREQTGSPQLQHNYNEAMEFIKSVNDD